MFRGEISEFYEENKDYICACAVVLVVCLACVWLVHDHTRNEPVYKDTNSTMAELDKRISGIEQRIDTMQKRLDATQKTVSGITDRVTNSTKLAGEVATGINEAESRLNDAIQRSGRIQNIIVEIERANRQGKTDTP